MNSLLEYWIKSLRSSAKGRRSSYKFVWALCFLDWIESSPDKNDLTLDEIYDYFAERYFNNRSMFGFVESVDPNREADFITAVNEVLANDESLFPFPEDRVGDYDNPRSKNMPEGSCTLYHWSAKESKVTVDKGISKSIKPMIAILRNLTILEWAKFIELFNSSPRIINKLEDALFGIERTAIPKWMRDYLKKYEKQCFYCGDSLKESEIEAEHFIPHSHIYSHCIWIIVSSCKDCNRGLAGKFDKIPNDKMLDKLIERNRSVYKVYSETQLKEFSSFPVLEGHIRNQYQGALGGGVCVWNYMCYKLTE